MRRANMTALRVIILAGMILFAFTGGILAVFHFLDKGGFTAKKQEENFYRILRQYDNSAVNFTGSPEEYKILSPELDRLEKRAIGVETLLSVLKRRRAIAQSFPQYTDDYNSAVNRAVKIYPLSQPLAAVAAASRINETGVRAEEDIRGFLELITDSSYNTLRLSSYILLGDLETPAKANTLPLELFSDGSLSVSLDFAILKVLRGDLRGAMSDIQTYLNSGNNRTDNTEASIAETGPYDSMFVRFAAEYHYDFGDLSRSAELFSLLEDDASLLRQADALYLAGFTESARSLWTILAGNMNGNSLYNLAATSQSQEESLAWLERMLRTIFFPDYDTEQGGNLARSVEFGLIRYSRFYDYNRASALLENAPGYKPVNNPFIDLEIIKRRSALQEPGRQAAETWLLLDRHLDNEYLYQWAAWLFFLQRYYGEAEILLKRNEVRNNSWAWTDVYRAVQFMRDGSLDKAESILRNIKAQSADWSVSANLGRILEAQLYTAKALEQYELTAAKLLLEPSNNKTASKVQYRIARCLSALGRGYETPRVLEYALDLDPENHTARLELDSIYQAD